MEIQQYIKDYTTLTKPKVNLLLVITALSAIFLASDSLPSINVLIAVIVGGTFASGGAGEVEHFIEVFKYGKSDAALAASVFHFDEIPIPALKKELKENMIEVRI